MMAKQNWFKRKPEEQAESPSKKLFQKDGTSSRRIEENLSEGWRDDNGSMVVEVQAQGGEVMGEGDGGDGMDVVEGGSAPEDGQTYNLLNETSSQQTGSIPEKNMDSNRDPVSIRLGENGHPQKTKPNIPDIPEDSHMIKHWL